MAGTENTSTDPSELDRLRQKVDQLSGEIGQWRADKYYLNKRLDEANKRIDAQVYLIELHRMLFIGFGKQIGKLADRLASVEMRSDRFSKKIHRLDTKGKAE